MNELQKASGKFMAEINVNELTCRIMEAVLGMKRPVGLDGFTALEKLKSENPKLAAEVQHFKQGALAAMYYWQETILSAKKAN